MTTGETETGAEQLKTHGGNPASAGETNNNGRSSMTIDGKSVASKGLGGTALGRIQNIEARLGALDVQNQATQDAIVQLKSDLCMRLANEAEKRVCGDNAIVNYANATFYPKMVASVTTGTDTTAQSTYNPLQCDCNGRAA